MAKFMCTHTIPAGKFSADQLRQLAKAAQQDPVVKGYRSFANLAEGKAVWVMEASNKEALAAWFAKPIFALIRVHLRRRTSLPPIGQPFCGGGGSRRPAHLSSKPTLRYRRSPCRRGGNGGTSPLLPRAAGG